MVLHTGCIFGAIQSDVGLTHGCTGRQGVKPSKLQTRLVCDVLLRRSFGQSRFLENRCSRAVTSNSSERVTLFRRQPTKRIVCRASLAAKSVPDGSVSAILLAGGVGKRMGAAIPKQYLTLMGQAIATFSMVTFAQMAEVMEIVVVCEPEYRQVFEQVQLPRQVPVKFALPGKERQDSVFNGLQAISGDASLVAIHDSARPLMDQRDVRNCLTDAWQVGAAVLGVPVKPTIKEVNKDGMVVKTLQRSVLWEVQTPQVIKPELLREGFALVQQDGLEVTDDVSIVEALGLPVRVTPGSYTNIKITTPDDLTIAERFMLEKQASTTEVAA